METNKNANNKVDVLRNLWLGMRDDYRTLVGLEGVNVVEKTDDLDEEAGNV